MAAEIGNGIDDPIFLLGFARSGTTWVNKLLRDYLDVGLVNEGKFIVTFGKQCKPTERIADLDHFIEKLSKSHFFDLMSRIYGISIDWGEIQKNPRAREYSYLIKLILSEIARKQGKAYIGSKNPDFGWNMEVLLGHFPNCRIVHLIRDGRDCALSHYELVWGCQNAYVTASKWHKYIGLVRESVKEHSVDYMEVRYEDLLADPAEAFARIEKFVCAGPGVACGGPETARTFAASIGEGAYEKRTGKWRTRMSRHDQVIFESVAGETLANLGYKVSGDTKSISILSRAGYVASDRMQREFWHMARKMSKRIQERKP